ncbi:MAG TPA: hypothetical protein VLT86_07315 [Vicinamibacterales bacterium]|nr:hypothetical protein [Vicinamibacterales bacterium]
MSRLAVGLLLVALPVALVAQQATKPPQAPAKAPATSTAVFPKGTYGVTMQDGSVLEVTFGDGTYSATSDGQPVAAGKYTTKGNQIIVSDNSDACSNSGEGTYTWAFDGKALTFKGSQDGCDTRLGIMTGYAFVKK